MELSCCAWHRRIVSIAFWLDRENTQYFIPVTCTCTTHCPVHNVHLNPGITSKNPVNALETLYDKRSFVRVLLIGYKDYARYMVPFNTYVFPQRLYESRNHEQTFWLQTPKRRSTTKGHLFMFLIYVIKMPQIIDIIRNKNIVN